MSWIKGFFSFWYDFIVGDDWRLAAGVVGGLALTAFMRDHSFWPLLPAVILVALVVSLSNARASR